MTVKSSTLAKSISTLFADGLFSTTSRFCLVPSALYQEEDQDLWLNFGQEHVTPSQQIIAEEISWQQCICLHETTADNPLNDTTGHNKQHAVTAFLHWLDEQCLREGLICAKRNTQIVLILLVNGQLQLATLRNVETEEDILYHIMNIFTQWQLPSTTFMVYTTGLNEKERTLLDEYITIQNIS